MHGNFSPAKGVHVPVNCNAVPSTRAAASVFPSHSACGANSAAAGGGVKMKEQMQLERRTG